MKAIYIISGSITLGLGILGIFLPLLPTTPFLLLSAALYCRGSRRLYGWLMSNRHLGPYVSNYRLKRAITLPAKIVSLVLLWGSILGCIIFITDILWLRIVLGAVLAGVTLHILSFRTIRKRDILKIIMVRTSENITALAVMAGEIWREYYPSLIGMEQTDYMLARMQSAEAIAEQIEIGGFEYYFINLGGRNIGYMAVKPDSGRLFLSKLYILKAARGKGCAREALTFLSNICRRRGLGSVWLTVNRNNRASVDIYLKSGFTVTGEKVSDIGNGYVMDDLVMEMTVG